MMDNRLIRHLEIESFKSIARLDQELGQLTVLVGENSAGKSSFMQAIVLASQIANSSSTSGLLSLIGDDVTLGDFRNIRHSGLASDEITIAVTLRDDTAMSRPLLEASATPREEFRWRMTLSEPRPPAVGASLRRVAVSSSLIDEEIVISQIDPLSEDSGERDRARELRRLLQRSIALTRAAGDGSLEIAAAAAADDTALLYSGTHSLGGRTSEGLEFISIDGALPALTLRSGANRRTAAQAFLWMGGIDRSRRDLQPDPGETEEDYIADDLLGAFESWLSDLDDALAARSGQIVIPPSRVETEWIGSMDFDTATGVLTDASIPGAVERDHLHRAELGVTTAAENIRAALAQRVHLLGPLRDEPSPWYRPGERGTGMATLGSKGQYTVAYLDEHGSDRVVCPIPADLDGLVEGDDLARLDDADDSGPHRSLVSAVHLWLRALGIARRVEVRPLGRKLELIGDMLLESWWQDVSVEILDDARKRLRDIVVHLDASSQEPLYANFRDELASVEERDISDLGKVASFASFRRKATAYLREHLDDGVIKKIHTNQPLTGSDLDELRSVFVAAGIGSPADMDSAASRAGSFAVFIRSLTGLDRTAAKEAFGRFLMTDTYRADQIRFVNLVIDYLTRNGTVDPARLYDSPFTDISPSGPEDLFNVDEIVELLKLLDTFQRGLTPT